MKTWRRTLLRESLLALAYACCIAGQSLFFTKTTLFGSVMGIAGPTALCLVLARGYKSLPALAAGFLLAEAAIGNARLPAGFVVILTYVPIFAAAAFLFRRFTRPAAHWSTLGFPTGAFVLTAILTPVATGIVTLAVLRTYLNTTFPEFAGSPHIYLLVVHWARESAGTLGIGPFLLLYVLPVVGAWLDDDCSVPPAKLTGQQVVETAFHAVAGPCCLGLALWLKSAFGLTASGFAFLPLLAAARHGVAPASASVAAQVLSCSVVYVALGWSAWLHEDAFRTLLVCGVVPVILVATRVDERNRAQQKMAEVETEFRTIAAHAAAVREDERTRICTSIVRDLRPGLTELKQQIGKAGVLLSRCEDAEFRREAASAAASVDGLMQTVRRLATDLRPGVLDSLGLDAAIEWLVSDSRSRLRTPCVLRRLDRVSLSKRVATAYFRLLQATLRMAAEQNPSELRLIEVGLQRSGRLAVLTIHVHGKSRLPEIELLSLRERVALAGGELKIAIEDDGDLIRLEARACDIA